MIGSNTDDQNNAQTTDPAGAGPLRFAVNSQSAGKSLIKAVLGHYPDLTAGTVLKALKHKDIRLNGRRLRADEPVAAGDQIMIYLPARFSPAAKTEEVSRQDGTRSRPDAPAYSLLYRDSQILVIRKMPGLSVQPGRNPGDAEPTLIDRLHVDLANPAVCLCHRIDRQTGGLLLAAAHPAACAAVRRLMQQGLINKRYRCLVRGLPEQGQPILCQDGTPMQEITAWLEKVASRSDVYIHDQKQPGDVPITTRYRILRVFPTAGPDGEAVSELEIELVTGRTHQIRAHLAHLGHPLLGDGKYGRNSYNRHFAAPDGYLRRQQLWATALKFSPDCPQPLAYLSGRLFEIEPAYDWSDPALPAP